MLWKETQWKSSVQAGKYEEGFEGHRCKLLYLELLCSERDTLENIANAVINLRIVFLTGLHAPAHCGPCLP